MREETIMASVVKHTADLMQENYKLKSDLKTAHEIIRELREALEFYGDRDNWTQVSAQQCSSMIGPNDHDFWDEYRRFTAGARARAVLSKHAEFLKKIGTNNDR